MDYGEPNYQAFADGTTIASDIGPLSLQCVSAGCLSCATGRIVVVDAGLPLDGVPFGQEVSPGHHEVIVTLARSARGLATQVAYGK